ncbi:hypothetical protein D0T87_00105 [Bacteroides sp. 51]|nr:hypothetical protein [Bacteroides sp. 51]
MVKSLSKSEKKAIYLRSTETKSVKGYMELFKMIDKQKISDSKILSECFMAKHPRAAFIPVVGYLYDYILRVLVDIKQHQDQEYALYSKVLKAKILLERNLNADSFQMIQQLQGEAEGLGNYYISLIARRMELDHVLLEEFNGFSEKDLIQKENQISDTLKIVRQINEQAYLYELLRYRIQKHQYVGSSLKLQAFNDLIISEITLTSKLRNNIFQIDKMHQLFQANYFISIGDYKSALNSFYELNKLFLRNKKLWNNPPVYYVMVLEGILESLKRIGEYDQMEYYLNNLRQLDYPSVYFQVEIACIDFIYSAIPHLDRGEYKESLEVIERFRSNLIQKIEYLRPQQYLHFSVYMAVIYLMNKKLGLARKQLAPIIVSDSYYDIWIYRPIQLLNLIIYYEKGDFEYVDSGVRSIKRRNKLMNKTSKIEALLFRFFHLDVSVMNPVKRKKMGQRFAKELETMVFDFEERRILSVFDFPKWIISHFEK